MPLQDSGQISVSEIMAEFGKDPGTQTTLSEFYGLSTLPASGQISASNFYGTSAASPNFYLKLGLNETVGNPQVFAVSKTHRNEVFYAWPVVDETYFAIYDLGTNTVVAQTTYTAIFGALPANQSRQWGAWSVGHPMVTGSYTDGTFIVTYGTKPEGTYQQDNVGEIKFNGSSFSGTHRPTIFTVASPSSSTTNNLRNWGINNSNTKAIFLSTDNTDYNYMYCDRPNTSSNWTLRQILPKISSPVSGETYAVSQAYKFFPSETCIFGANDDKMVTITRSGGLQNLNNLRDWLGITDSQKNPKTYGDVTNVWVWTRSGNTWSRGQRIRPYDFFSEPNGPLSHTNYHTYEDVFENYAFSPDMQYIGVWGRLSKVNANATAYDNSNHFGSIGKFNGTTYTNFRAFKAPEAYLPFDSNAENKLYEVGSFSLNNDGQIFLCGSGFGTNVDISSDTTFFPPSATFYNTINYNDMVNHTNMVTIPASNTLPSYLWDNNQPVSGVVRITRRRKGLKPMIYVKDCFSFGEGGGTHENLSGRNYAITDRYIHVVKTDFENPPIDPRITPVAPGVDDGL